MVEKPSRRLRLSGFSTPSPPPFSGIVAPCKTVKASQTNSQDLT